MGQGCLSADTAEDGGDVGDGAYLGLLVALALGRDNGVTVGQFLREHHGKALADAYLAEFLPENEGQGAVVGLREVGQTDLRGIEFGSGSHRGDKGDTAVDAMGDKGDLRGQGINRIDEKIRADNPRLGAGTLNERRHIVLGKVFFHLDYLQFRIDV